MSECALCPKGPRETWLGGIEVGDHIICMECYTKLPVDDADLEG